MTVTSLISRVILFVTLLSFGALSDAKVTGTVRSCKKIPLMRHENLFEFLRAGHVYHYRDVNVEYSPDVEPVLLIYDDEKREKKSIKLTDHSTSLKDIHHLFETYFEKKDDREISKISHQYSKSYVDELERRKMYLEKAEL